MLLLYVVFTLLACALYRYRTLLVLAVFLCNFGFAIVVVVVVDWLQVPPPAPPPSLGNRVLDVSLKCGYQRLRKALLWNDSKLQAAFADLLVMLY